MEERAGLTRRQMISAIAAAALPGANTATTNDDAIARARALIANTTVVDIHNHFGLWQTKGLLAVDPVGKYTGDTVLTSIIREHLDAGINCTYLDTVSDIARTRLGRPGSMDRAFCGDEAWLEYLRQMAEIRGMLDRFPLAVASHADDIAPINAAGKMACFLSTEGGHMIDTDISRLEILYRDGLRRFQPMHYVQTALGDNQTDPPVFGGLSDIGKAAIALANELGMIIDVAHGTRAVVEQVLDLVGDKPVVLSHTMLAYHSSRFGEYRKTRTRWIDTDHARLIADSGGIIGTFPVMAPWGVDTLDAFIEALARLVDVVGIDHVAWATDLIQRARPSFLRDYRQFDELCAQMLSSGFTESDVRKFIGENAIRVHRAVVG